MFKSDLGDICGRFLSSRLSDNSSSSSKISLNNEHIANEHKRHTILNQKLIFKPYKKNPLDQLRKRYSNLVTNTTNDVILTTINQQSVIKHSTSKINSSSLMMNWEIVKDRGSGLINLGNTCFINASLQCLANTPPLVQWLLSNSHHQYCRMKLEKRFCLFCEAERIVKLIHSKTSYSSSMGPANPNNIARRIKDISKTFRFGRQEDASEFLICLIDKIVEACLRSSQPPERLRPSSGTSYEQLCHSQTFLHDLFGLVLRSRVICSRCRHTSDTFEVQYTWIVSVRNHSDLRQSLQQFVCRETLSGENLYRCMKCKQLVPAIKRYTLHKASKILLINFKRFEFGKNSHKLSHLVRYPEYLNVKSYMSEENSNDQSLDYRLYAVLVHVGSSMHSGHYYSYVRSPNNRWYKADDTTMTQCDLNQVLTQHGAYILCYIKETESSSTNIITNGTSKTVHQNGKLTNGEYQSKFFIPHSNLSRQSMCEELTNELIEILILI
jgi:ubiquitin carboxyl-terminal hydrolase 36/42